MTAKIYNIKDYEPIARSVCDEDYKCNESIDDVVGDWIESLHEKIYEIYFEYSPETAYQFHHRVCGTDLSFSRTVVDIIINNYEEFEDNEI